MRKPYHIIEVANTHGGDFDYINELIYTFNDLKEGYGIKFQPFHADCIATNDYDWHETYKKLHFEKQGWEKIINHASETKDVWLDIFDIYGIDVSKAAIHYASGRDKGIRFAVASNYHIPVLKGTLDCILCSFAPRDEGEFRRILKPKGKLIVASPGARHLYSIREALYESPEEIGQKGTVGEGFTLLEKKKVNYEIILKSKQDILNLFTMTPYSRHAETSALEKLSEFATEVDINIFVYSARPAGRSFK